MAKATKDTTNEMNWDDKDSEDEYVNDDNKDIKQAKIDTKAKKLKDLFSSQPKKETKKTYNNNNNNKQENQKDLNKPPTYSNSNKNEIKKTRPQWV